MCGLELLRCERGAGEAFISGLLCVCRHYGCIQVLGEARVHLRPGIFKPKLCVPRVNEVSISTRTMVNTGYAVHPCALVTAGLKIGGSGFEGMVVKSGMRFSRKYGVLYQGIKGGMVIKPGTIILEGVPSGAATCKGPDGFVSESV